MGKLSSPSSICLLRGANGIYYDATAKVVSTVGLGENFNGRGEIYKLAINDSDAHFEPMTVAASFFNGISSVDATHLIYSDWVDIQKPTLGTINIFNLQTKQVETLTLPIESHEPANFYYQSTTGLIWLTLTIDGKVITLKID